MTFQSSSEQVIHVVSYPSVWLSTVRCPRILVLGYTESEIMQLVPEVQSHDHVSMTWYVCDFTDQINSAELDWCMCMSAVCDKVVCKPRNLTQLAVASHLCKHVSHWLPSDCEITCKLQHTHDVCADDITQVLLRAGETIKDNQTR